jgi:hypothetical protein
VVRVVVAGGGGYGVKTQQVVVLELPIRVLRWQLRWQRPRWAVVVAVLVVRRHMVYRWRLVVLVFLLLLLVLLLLAVVAVVVELTYWLNKWWCRRFEANTGCRLQQPTRVVAVVVAMVLQGIWVLVVRVL